MVQAQSYSTRGALVHTLMALDDVIYVYSHIHDTWRIYEVMDDLPDPNDVTQ